jgi:hypothetical protein
MKYDDEAINDDNYTIIDFVQYVYKSFSSEFDINIRDEDFEEFLLKHMADFKVLCERAPTLWRYNIAGYVVANIFGDDDDIMKLKPLDIDIETMDDLSFEPEIEPLRLGGFLEDEIIIEKQ